MTLTFILKVANLVFVITGGICVSQTRFTYFIVNFQKKKLNSIFY